MTFCFRLTPSTNTLMAVASVAPELNTFLNGSADWCTPCKELDVKVFSKREVAEVMTRFTLLRVDMSKANDEPALGEISRRYDAETLPAVRVVSPEGKILAKIVDGELPHADRFRDKLVAALPAN